MTEKAEMLNHSEIQDAVKKLLLKYHAEYALLFGSYARGEATAASDIDLFVFGGQRFKPTDIFAFAEELRELLGKDADVYESREIDCSTELYREIMKDGVKIAC